MKLFEGGNIWDDTSEYEQTLSNVDAIKKATEAVLKDIGLTVYPIGSSANPRLDVYIDDQLVGVYFERNKVFQPIEKYKEKYVQGSLPKGAKLVPRKSGDFDVIAEITDVQNFFGAKDGKTTRQALDDYLKQKGLSTYKSGVTVHVKIPVKGKQYQVDIKLVSNAPSVKQYHTHEIPAGSPYKGVHKQLVLNTLASTQNMLWNPDEGLYKRDSAGKKAELLATDLDQIAKLLIGPKASAASLGSVESILSAIPDEKRRKEVMDIATQSRSWQSTLPQVTEWFRSVLDILK